MGLNDRSEAFSSDKFNFFSRNFNNTNVIKEHADSQNYSFLKANKNYIDDEFNLLFNELKEKARLSEDTQDLDRFWYYCYYCCSMLQRYHVEYGHKSKAKDFSDYCEKIKARCDTKGYTFSVAEQDSFFTFIGKKIDASLKELQTSPLGVIRETITSVNIQRIYWVFCQGLLNRSFLLAHELKWLDKIAKALNRNINVDNIISVLKKPNNIFRVLSVGFSVVRFIINAGFVLKQTFRKQAEEDKESRWKLFAEELAERHPIFLNDLAWGTVNLVTGYYETFGIAASTANWLVAGFLLFDFCVIVWRRHLAEQDYLLKKAQFAQDIRHFEHDPAHYKLLVELNNKLDISWQAQNSKFWFNAAAALLLMGGFSASLMLTPPVMALACYVLCTFAVAMYLSANEWGVYDEKSRLLKHAETNNVGIEEALKDYKKARNDFYLTLTENFLMPTLFIAAYAICWEAAVILTAAYIIYKLYSYYEKNNQLEPLDKKQSLLGDESIEHDEPHASDAPNDDSNVDVGEIQPDDDPNVDVREIQPVTP